VSHLQATTGTEFNSAPTEITTALQQQSGR